jgi:hypothetical protein
MSTEKSVVPAEQRHKILRAISKGPRQVHDFTHKTPGSHADVQVHPKIFRRYVADLEEAGLLVHNDDDSVQITAAGLMEVNCPTSIASTRKICSASMPKYEPKPWACTRVGCDDHKRFKSLTL